MKFPRVLRNEIESLLHLALENGKECQARQPGPVLSIEPGTEIDKKRKSVLISLTELRRQEVSRQAAERQLDNALVAAAKGAVASDLVEQLAAFFTATPHPIDVIIPVGGISARCLPFTFGGIQFHSTTSNEAEQILTHLTDPDWNAHIRENFLNRNTCIARATEKALDDAAASEIVVSRMRNVVDALNFFAPIVDGPEGAETMKRNIYGARVFLLSDGVPDVFQVLTLVPSAKRSTIKTRGDRKHADAWFPPIDSEQAVRIGMDRISDILKTPPKKGVPARVLRAVKLIGRANAESRDDEAMLFYVAALEALVVGGAGELTYKTSINVASLFRSIDRRWVFDTVNEAYKLRSKLVHGEAMELDEGTLNSIREIATVSTSVIIGRFSDPNAGEKDLLDWIRDRLFPISEAEQ